MPTDESMKAARALYDAAGYGYPNAGDIAAALDAAYERGKAEERERCAGIAVKYGNTPLGGPDNDTAKAHEVGMTYTQGGSDTAFAIESAISEKTTDDLLGDVLKRMATAIKGDDQ